MKILWKERKVTGDYIVKSKQDNIEQKYHKFVLITMEFFHLQHTQSKNFSNEEKNQHTTDLHSKIFKNLTKIVYLQSIAHLGPLDSIFLLDKEKEGLFFYFAATDNDNNVFFMAIRNGLVKAKFKINEKNVLDTLLFTLKNHGHEKLQVQCGNYLMKLSVSEMISKYDLKDQNLILSNCNQTQYDLIKNLIELNQKSKKKINQYFQMILESEDSFFLQKQAYVFYEEKQYDKAFILFKKSADKENDVSIFSVGVCYEFGEGVEKSIETAIAFYKRAANMGYQNAIDALNRLSNYKV
eukprot:TRINITY_DN6708_c0_g1_i1.p1 TRINITY_DN6708_c0_g1~~TRINITY_DN6708_c0_g1_i1.p1  ORF type:complete len:296 (-),score=81.36 TRINITY_DN6708_c0_g1_i1:15-902(-)